jgi:hypothetical protein
MNKLISHPEKRKIIILKWQLLNLRAMKTQAMSMDEDHKAKNDLSR